MDDCEPIIPPEDKNIYFRFISDYNLDHTDQFEEDIEHIRLFILDEENSLIADSELDVDYLDENGATFAYELTPGKYRAVTWGNTHQDIYDLVLADNFENHKLRYLHDHVNNSPIQFDTFLFHGLIDFEVIDDAENEEIPIQLKNNNNKVTIYLEGIKLTDNPDKEKDITVRIEGSIPLYDFENNLIGEEIITYYPSYPVPISDGNGGWLIRADFETHRLNYATDLKIVVYQPGIITRIHEEPLQGLLVDQYLKESYGGKKYSEKYEEIDEYFYRRYYYDIKDNLVFELGDDKTYVFIEVSDDTWHGIEEPGAGI